MDDTSIFITGSNGQLGRALKTKYPGAKKTTKNELDITNEKAINEIEWSKYKILINTAAYTNVDGAETKDGKKVAWDVNDIGVSILSKAAIDNDLILIHISTEYIFDGKIRSHLEDESPNPLSEYGKSKAAGEAHVKKIPKHYLLRTSWVIGDGNNFVRTVLELGKKGVSPTIVDDQVGRLTFTSELVRAIDYLLLKHAKYGTYNISNEGEPSSWADINRTIFKIAGFNLEVKNISTKEYFTNKPGLANRPLNSTLSLEKIESIGFAPVDWKLDLRKYIEKELAK